MQTESEWKPFEHDGERFEWCTARDNIRCDVPRHVVVVRAVGQRGPARGVAFSMGTELTEEHARTVVDRMAAWKEDP